MAEIKRRRPLTKEEIEQEEFLENRRIYREQISQLRRKWEEVLKEVETRRRMRAEEEHRLAGKQHLNQMLEHSTQLLEARRGDRHNSMTASEGGLDMAEGEGGDEEGEYDGEEGGEGEEEDDNMPELEEELDEANMSTTDSDEEEVEDDDGNLTVEQLKAKYSGLGPSQASPGGKGLIQEDDLSDIEDGMSLDGGTPVPSDVPSDDENPEGGAARMDVDEIPTEAVELEEVDEILIDDSDESVDMDSEDETDGSESSEDDDSEDDSEGENGFGSGLLGLYGDLSGLGANSRDLEPESEDENEFTEPVQKDRSFEKSPDSMQIESLSKGSKINGSKLNAADELLEEDRIDEVSLVVYKSPPGKAVGDNYVSAPRVVGGQALEIPMLNGHSDTMDVETSTSLSHSQIDLKESGHPSSLTTSPETSPQPNIDIKTPIPFLLRGTLREYQHYGLDWLAGLYNNHTNGILADEMGLGKTIQTIALLAHLACEKEVWGPHLIVVPTSVMLNWEMEKGWFDNNLWHVCITSYQLVLQDQVTFKRRNWHYLILDEAHNIKNFRSQRWQTLLNFKAEARLLITGTPLQNNLIELWSLLYFLMPSGASSAMPAGFANLKEFQEWFAHPLHRVLRPYLLRRLKADVEKQMPAKFEHIVYCRLSKRQRYLYEEFMSMAKTRETLASGNYLSIINCLMQLRKVCNHPDLFETRQIVTSFAMQKSVVADYEVKELLYDCGKLQRLDLLLRQLQAGGHRALIFTQMTKVLDILEQFLNIHGHRYLRLDGATKVEQRQILTDRFNNDTRILVFILSTRSGGLGINLTGADTVIFYDLDWNPAMDKQCQDRCHRIGQTRDVHIYRFVSEYTIESNILRKSNQKRMLDDVVIQEGDFTTDYFNKLTIRDMLGDEVIKDLDGVDDSQAVVAPGVNMEKALEAAEDVEDVAAAKVAQREVVDADGADFAERSTPAQTPGEPGTATTGTTPREPSAPVSNVAMTPQGNTVELEVVTHRGLGYDIYGDGWNRVDREPAHIDEYMIRYMEWELVDVPLVLPSKSKKKKSKKGKKF
ncbi:P-loop containing nucleoside triphosphate hydrolase protein [Tuber brumale]|nr:P-loop containing nucleoside triphosphate hydrolase protein [Tuber brumale]